MKRKTLSLLFALLLAVYFMPWSMAESKGTFYMKNEELGFSLTLNNLSEEDITVEVEDSKVYFYTNLLNKEIGVVCFVLLRW